MITGSDYLADFMLKTLNCYYVQLHNVTVNGILIGHNMMGESVLYNITSDGINITYDDNISMESVNFHEFVICIYTTKLYVKMEQNFYEMSIIITDSIFSGSITVFITSSCITHHENTIVFSLIKFLSSPISVYDSHFISINFNVHNHHCSNKAISKCDKVVIKNCFFLNNSALRNDIIYTKWLDRINKTK